MNDEGLSTGKGIFLLTLPAEPVNLILVLAPIFSKSDFEHAGMFFS